MVAYREVRRLELDVLKVLRDDDVRAGHRQLDIGTLVKVDVNQFHGIEIDEFPSQIAQVALWLTDHQMNR